MSYVTTADGTRIFYRDFGQGQPIVFSHGWPLNADAWDGQMLFLSQNGFRVIAHDRRGHGRSDQPATGNEMDTYADDLATVIDALDLTDAILVGHSTGGGEISRYVGRHGTARVAKMVLLGAVTPIMVKTADNPDGVPIEVFDGVRKAVADNRSQFYLDFPETFFGFNRGVPASEGLRQAFWQQGMSGGAFGQYACVRQFSESDFTADLKAIDVPTLVIHGDADQVVPFATTGKVAATLVPDASLIVYEGAPHGFPATHQDRLNADLLAFARS
ncbi:alpha/beta hydrolase [Sphingomonas naphthae]|uniref:Alpha/beta hydrolase n=1 Tax=Sphingomonas naphthae TaxID=1813468 RepID=A0ABY7TRH4_9SPHN|nr:alpha/beta hydrolase [Sphingomonas naphthae]WCT74424.1 alpha/beta hydrolase [Sphingomonas naphthae]